MGVKKRLDNKAQHPAGFKPVNALSRGAHSAVQTLPKRTDRLSCRRRFCRQASDVASVRTDSRDFPENVIKVKVGQKLSPEPKISFPGKFEANWTRSSCVQSFDKSWTGLLCKLLYKFNNRAKLGWETGSSGGIVVRAVRVGLSNPSSIPVRQVSVTGKNLLVKWST